MRTLHFPLRAVLNKPQYILKIKNLQLTPYRCSQHCNTPNRMKRKVHLIMYNVRLFETFKCLQGHSTRNKGFGKFRDVYLDNSSLLFYFLSILT